ncbi:MAG TPA: nuclear transport factor 2 family protein [Chitinophagaceae bacterium]|jgi:ketosteroid isomerase-like protein|nr:nuclear transport factor 2 family protein [Chitinophagaceae bacterium]HNA90845.1 nuclear transport factor 2 family protein [Chitinophagaceae bacterium]HND94571.1 nuclear transport factor 2 family protein [Chitinophagaceae bacterium]HNJ25573.1 nuclear transport factor 2 family protein [Chitinophagaceae bacterium]HNN99320.1 nuclear transport factor 2 family protein [Chitinophagaceae bacterium]
MNNNEELITRFYSAFQKLDATTMNSCYSDDIIFSDPVFGLLKGEEVRAMWEMLCQNAKDFSLSFSNIQHLDEEYATCQWVASYTFSKTGRRVVNNIKAYMRFADGKIVEHSDAFKISKWAAQALGWKGAVFGWTGWMQRKIKKNAKANLEKFNVNKRNQQ